MKNEITSTEAIELMNRCKQEIAQLRHEIEFLRPKADAYDNLAAILRLLPQRSVGMGENIIWLLDKRIQELTPKPAAEPVDAKV